MIDFETGYLQALNDVMDLLSKPISQVGLSKELLKLANSGEIRLKEKTLRQTCENLRNNISPSDN